MDKIDSRCRHCIASGSRYCNNLYAGKEVSAGGCSGKVHEIPARSTQATRTDRSYEKLGRSQAAKRALVATVGLFLVGCVSVPYSRVCSAVDVPTRWPDAQIEQMSDEQVKNELARNEDLAKRGCAVPNK